MHSFKTPFRFECFCVHIFWDAAQFAASVHKAWFAFEYMNVTGIAHESTLSETGPQNQQLKDLKGDWILLFCS